MKVFISQEHAMTHHHFALKSQESGWSRLYGGGYLPTRPLLTALCESHKKIDFRIILNPSCMFCKL